MKKKKREMKEKNIIPNAVEKKIIDNSLGKTKEKSLKRKFHRRYK